ncbi:MAG: lysophospholipid acyltransferase family protein [Candidatus Aminicenantes bacterium]|nr:lysophospholipid acyltransferase family protein [Candidatus Aminicenantes bacterium]
MSVWKEIRWNLIGWMGRSILRFLAFTSRISVVGGEHYEHLRAEKKPVVILIWHGRILLATYFFRNKNIMPLISPSQDGEIIVRILAKWRYKILRGSSSHSVFDAWKKMKRELLNKGEVIIVPDGPKGPDRKMKPGGVKLACETNAFLLPFSFSASRRKLLKSWDSFLLFPPFSRVVVFFGEPIECKKGTSHKDLDLLCRRVENILIDLDKAADQYFNKKKND